ncbi:PAS domain-containing protein [Candidatus Bathyarchaeota archaeon]|nr:PAS domain-containing protein [Candidatus Bathyarchaeota archaeon]
MITENKKESLLSENQALRDQLIEAQETLRAIRQGEVDALVINTPEGPRTYTLSGAETPYRLLIEEMREGAVMLCEDNTVLYCNKGFAQMVQVPLDRLMGSNIEEVVAPEHLGNFRQLIEACRQGKRSISKEITFKAKANKIVPAFVSASSLRTEEKTTVFIVVTDLSLHMEDDLKQYTQDLEATVRERTNQLKDKERLAAIGQTASMVGHDIRNPLQSIVSELYLAREELEGLPEGAARNALKDSVQMIEEQTFYINKIVADLQDFTKPLTPKPQPIELASTIKESLLSIVIPQSTAVNLDLRDKIKIYSDPLYLKRILVNLVSNALQAMPNGGKLTIRTDYTDEHVSIAVKDTGPGIPDDVKPNIFQPLFTTKAKGQGLGLAVVKRLTEALKGTATFESQPGDGTSFIVKVPLDMRKTG